jgi:hypothetical protein
MDKVYQVFVSSTFSDLKDERLQVSNTLAKAGYIAAGMELFPATDQQQLEYIKRVIDRSDYYVVIVGGRYGTIADESASFTEREFEYAHSKNIPVLAFLHQDPRKLPVEKTDEDPAKAILLEQFRTRLASGRIVEFWTDVNDLCTKVVIAVANAVNLRPGVGWVRGDQAIDPKVLQETERLRIENAELHTQLSLLQSGENSFDPTLLGPSDRIALEIIVHARYGQRKQPPLSVEVVIGDLFLDLYDKILTGPREHNISYDAASAAAKQAELYDSEVSYDLNDANIAVLRDQFSALGLILPMPSLHTDGVNYIAWSITEKGRRFASEKRALRKAEPK